jgi:hypothetical protein
VRISRLTGTPAPSSRLSPHGLATPALQITGVASAIAMIGPV